MDQRRSYKFWLSNDPVTLNGSQSLKQVSKQHTLDLYTCSIQGQPSLSSKWQMVGQAIYTNINYWHNVEQNQARKLPHKISPETKASKDTSLLKYFSSGFLSCCVFKCCLLSCLSFLYYQCVSALQAHSSAFFPYLSQLEPSSEIRLWRTLQRLDSHTHRNLTNTVTPRILQLGNQKKKKKKKKKKERWRFTHITCKHR